MENGVDLGAEGNGGNANSGSEVEAQMVNGASDVTDRSELGVPKTDVAKVSNVSERDDATDKSEQEVPRTNGVKVSTGSEQEADDTNVGDESGSQVVTVVDFNSRSDMDPHIVNDDEVQVVGERRSLPNGDCVVLSSEPATKEKVIPRPMTVRGKHGPAKIRDDDDVGTEASVGIYNSVSNVEVRMRPVDHVSGENKGAAHPSVEKNVEPDQSKNENHGNQTSQQNDVPLPIGKESCVPILSIDKGKGITNDQTGDIKHGNLSCSPQNNVPRAGLMERNSTSHTYEWDDSLGMSPEPTNSTCRFHLPCPKRNAFSPLNNYEDERLPKRRKVKRWSLQEVDTLRTGVQKYGSGKWKCILEAHRDVFEDRTEVDLKDKWRNMTK